MYIIIAVLIFFGAFVLNYKFNHPTFKCTHCDELHDVNNVKTVKRHVTYAHTRKDGGRDRRFNQSGTQHYDLTFECKSCNKEFEATHRGKVNHFEKIADEEMYDNWEKVDDAMGEIADAIEKGEAPY